MPGRLDRTRNVFIRSTVLVLFSSFLSGAVEGATKDEEKLETILKYARTYDENKKRYEVGLDRINKYRKLAKVRPMRLDQKFCMAAQAHADYLVGRGSGMSHQQQPGTVGFIGKEFKNRIAFFAGKKPVFECISTNPDPAKAVDGLIDSVYHRLPFLNPENDRVGIGLAPKITVLDFGAGRKSSSKTVLFPLDGQRDVVPFWRVNESPNPVAQFGSPAIVGYPISVRFPKPIEFVSASLSCAKQKEVPIFILHKGSDKTNFLKNDVFILAKQQMAPSTRYSVVVEVKMNRVKKTVRWSFTTSADTPPKNIGRRKK
jgi:hypothetical protein